MAPERILPPTSVREALLSQVTLMGFPWAWCISSLGMEGWGPCEVRRGICVQPIVPRLSSGAPKTPSLPMCGTQNNTAQLPQSVWDKGDVLQSPPIWCCLPDVLIPPDKSGNTLIPNRHVFCDNEVGLILLRVYQCCQAFAVMLVVVSI